MNRSLSVLSWNVHLTTFAHGNRYVVEQMEQLDKPDVICLQEYVDGADSTTKDWFENNGYEIIFLPFAVFPKDSRISQGVMVAAKKTLKASLTTHVLRSDGPRAFRRFNNIRGLAEAVVTFDKGKKLHIINVHSTFARHYTIDMRKREFAALKDYLAAAGDEPVLLCGDFNFVGSDPRKKYLKKLYSSFTGSLLSPTWRHLTKLSPISANLDYFFWSRRGISVEPRLLGYKKSDHRALYAKIDIV